MIYHLTAYPFLHGYPRKIFQKKVGVILIWLSSAVSIPILIQNLFRR